MRTKTKKSIAIAILIALAIICFSALPVLSKPAYATTEPAENESYELLSEDGTSKTGLYAGTGVSSAEFLSVGYSVNSKMLYLNGFFDNKAAVIAFPEINTANYRYMDLLVYKNVNYAITMSTFKNDANYTADKVATNSYAFNNAGGVLYKGYVRINIAELADENGKISSFIIRHESSDTESSVVGNLNILSATVQPYNDYTLKIDGIDMVNGTAGAGANFATLITHTPSGKLYANNYTRGTAVSLKFGTVINVADYKTLELNMCFYNMGMAYDFYIEGYKYGTANLSEVDPSALLYINHNPEFHKPVSSGGTPYVLKINLEDFADDNGNVQGIILYHLSDDRATDLNACSLYIFESYVKKAADTTAENKRWPSEVQGIAYTKNFDTKGHDRIVFTFDAPMFSATPSEITVDDKLVNGFAKNVLINGTELVKGDILSATAGYEGSKKKLALTVNGLINNEGEDLIQYKKGATLIVADKNGGESQFFARENKEYLISRALGDGETMNLGVYSYVKDVGAVYSASATVINIRFNIAVGSLSSCNPLENIYIGTTKLSSNAAVTCKVSDTDETVLSVTIPQSSGVLATDGSNVLTIESGMATENVYITENSVYEQKSADNTLWFIQSEKPVYVLWVQDFDVSETTANFTLKLSAEYTGEDITGFNIVTFDKIKINGKALSEILVEDASANVVLSGQFLKITVSATSFTLTDTDRITVEKGFAVPYGGTVGKTVAFKYVSLWEEFEHVTDISDIESKLTTVNVKMIETPSEAVDKATYIMVTFAQPVSYRFYPYVHRHAKYISNRYKDFPTTNPSDLYISQLSQYGITDSVLDNIVFDGKTIREWIEYDKRTSTDWENSIDVRFLGTGVEMADRIQICFNTNSSAVMDLSKTHTMEIKEGFITPNLQRVDKSVTYSWDVLNKCWTGFSANSTETDQEQQQPEKTSGCGSALAVDAYVLSVMVTLLAGIILTAKATAKKR